MNFIFVLRCAIYRKKLIIIRRHIRDTRDPFEETTEQQFLDLYRFPKHLCLEFLNKINHYFNINERQSAISVPTRFLCALRYFATGNYQRAVGQDFMACMSQTSVHRCFHEVAEILNAIAHEYVTFPTEQEEIVIKAEFYNISSFPGIVGHIDGTHIKITAPRHDIEYAYYCRKGGHSINVVLICDSKYRIRYANARFPGTSHDAYVWRRSVVQEFLKSKYAEGKRNFWLLGDSGFPQQPWLMTPYRTASTRAMERYNVAHKTTRCMVERCIGILKSRFRCLSSHRILCFDPVTAGNVINACIVLHNVLTNANVPVEIDETEQAGAGNIRQPENIAPNLFENDNNILREGQRIRQNIIEAHFI